MFVNGATAEVTADRAQAAAAAIEVLLRQRLCDGNNGAARHRWRGSYRLRARGCPAALDIVH